MFKSATIKLTGWYLALIMGLSLAFSFVLYHSSSDSISIGFDHQRTALRNQFEAYYGVTPSPASLDRLQRNEMNAAQQRLLANLTLANIAVFVIGGGISFYMARRTLQPIEQAMEAQTRFTADASHELRTPLTAMQTEIEVALRDTKLSSKESRALLESNLEEVKSLQGLSNGLLALANQDKETFASQPQSTRRILADAVARVRRVAQQKNITIDHHTGDVHIFGDKDGLVQLFVILLDNALKYSNAGTTIKVTAFSKGGNACISIADQGHGIQAGDLPHIFERLYRADTSRNKERVDGYGLGLSIAKKIVDLHKGAIDVTSKVGKGSTFTVRIPLAAKTSIK